jgi:hypothetical protein
LGGKSSNWAYKGTKKHVDAQRSGLLRHLVAPLLSLSGFFLLSLKSQSGIFVPGLAAYSYSCASSSLVGLKKASNYISWPSFFRLFSIALMN